MKNLFGGEAKTQGLRTQESEKFNIFFEMVQNVARKAKKVFFLDAGDGNEFLTDEMEGEDLLGWLIPEDQADEFESAFKEFKELDEWDDYYVTVDCFMGNTLNIKFN